MADDDNETSQNDEIEALVSIYGCDTLKLLPSSGRNKSLEIQIWPEVSLRVSLPPAYPSESGPIYELTAPSLHKDEKEELEQLFQDILNVNEGMPVIFTLSECLKEFLEERSKSSSLLATNHDPDPKTVQVLVPDDGSSVQCPAILTGDCIEDRKSVFQGHFAHVQDQQDVKAVIARLYENRKIANAAHNMYAYRIKQPNGTGIQDFN